MCGMWPMDPRGEGKKELSTSEVEWVNGHFNHQVGEKLVKFIDNEVFLKSRYVIYTREQKQYKGYCTYCNKYHDFAKLKHNQEVRCPECFSLCVAKSSGIARGKMRDVARITVYEKSSKDPKIVVARAMVVSKDYRNEYKNIEIQYNTDAWYIFESNKKPFMVVPSWGNKHERRASAYSLYNKPAYHYGTNIECYFPEWSLKDAIKDTPFEYCDFAKCGRNTAYLDDYIEYMGIFSEIPKVEYFVKQGLLNLVKSKINKEPMGRLVNWKANSLEKALGLTMQEFREIRKRQSDITVKFLNCYKDNKINGWSLDVDQVFQVSDKIGYRTGYDRFKSMAKDIPARLLVNYVTKQAKQSKSRYGAFETTLTEYEDYIKECVELNMPLNQDGILFPKDLTKAHIETSKRVKHAADKKISAQIKKREKELKKMEMTLNGLVIISPKSQKNIIDEGNALSHCVGGYAKNHAEGKTTILFIREVDNLDKPFYTMEVKDGRVAQCMGFKHKNPTKRVEALLEAFKKQKLTKKSKRRTVQEVSECRA